MDLESESESEASVPKREKGGKQKQRQRCGGREKVNKRQSPPQAPAWMGVWGREDSKAWPGLLPSC